MDYVNPTPQTAMWHWVMDQMMEFKAGETVDFYGVNATWMAVMSPEPMKADLKVPYDPCKFNGRRNTSVRN